MARVGMPARTPNPRPYGRALGAIQHLLHYLPAQLTSALERQSNIQSLAAQPHLAARDPRLHSELQDMANRPMEIVMDAVWNWSWGMPIPVVVTGAMRSWWTGTQPPVGHH